MKITKALLVGLSSAKKPRSWGEEVNGDACIYDQTDGITTITTVERLTKETKCYKKFSCDSGSNVMVKVNSMGIGSFQTGDQFCLDNFIKLEYRVPREDNLDYPIETTYCDGSATEIGQWQTLDDHVWFSFEFGEFDYYDWFYGYEDYGDIESKTKFEIEFTCSEPVEPTLLPTTSMLPTTTLAPVPTTTPVPTGNQANVRLNAITNNWELMLDESTTMKSKAKKRTKNKFNRLADKMKVRHEKLMEAGCTFEASNQVNFGAVYTDFTDTCTTTDQLIQDLKFWGDDFIVDCKVEEGEKYPKSISKFWNKMTEKLDKFNNNMHRFAKCDKNARK